MKVQYPTLIGSAALFGLSAALWAQQPPPTPNSPSNNTSQLPPEAPGGVQVQGEVEVLTRGPVHEAFAAHTSIEIPTGTDVIVKAPPELIQEAPPDMMPEGENVEWIPGYWDWDVDRNDYIWVSGLWRDVPPGQRWIPGYFTQVEGGYQWVPGFWTSDQVAQVNYLPTPPATLEQGPNTESPGDNYFWVPGNWVYQDNYQWQPGYWAQTQPDWVWMPSQYYWTPSGYVYSAGFWDYPLATRGTLFAPAFFPGYSYGGMFTPQVAVPYGPLLTNLFVRRGYPNYYFGNYYGNNFAGMGMMPWINAPTMYGGNYYYDPLFSYYQFGAQRGTLDRLRGWNQFYMNNPDQRPPVTLAQSLNWRREMLNSRNANPLIVQQSLLGAQLRDITGDRNSGFGNVRFRQIDRNQMTQFTDRSQQIRELQRNRRQVEVAARGVDHTVARPISPDQTGRDRDAGNRQPGERGQTPGTRSDRNQGRPGVTLDLPRLERAQSRGGDAPNVNPERGAGEPRRDGAAPGGGRLPEPPRTRNPIDRGNRDAQTVPGLDGVPGAERGQNVTPEARERLDQMRQQMQDRRGSGEAPGRERGNRSPGTGTPNPTETPRTNPETVPTPGAAPNVNPPRRGGEGGRGSVNPSPTETPRPGANPTPSPTPTPNVNPPRSGGRGAGTPSPSETPRPGASPVPSPTPGPNVNPPSVNPGAGGTGPGRSGGNNPNQGGAGNRGGANNSAAPSPNSTPNPGLTPNIPNQSGAESRETRRPISPPENNATTPRSGAESGAPRIRRDFTPNPNRAIPPAGRGTQPQLERGGRAPQATPGGSNAPTRGVPQLSAPRGGNAPASGGSNQSSGGGGSGSGGGGRGNRGN